MENTCIYCGSIVQRLEHQSRAADEATSVIEVCGCRLDMQLAASAVSSMDTDIVCTTKTMPQSSPIMSTPLDVKVDIPQIPHSKDRALYDDMLYEDCIKEIELSASGAMAKSAWSTLARYHDSVTIAEASCTTLIQYGAAMLNAKCRTRSDGEIVTKKSCASTKLTIGVTYRESLEWTGTYGIQQRDVRRIVYDRIRFIVLEDMEVTCVRYMEPIDYRLEVEFMPEVVVTPSHVMRALTLMLAYCGSSTLSSVDIGPPRLSAIRHRMQKAHDSSYVSDLDHQFVTKSDGERFIMIKCGYIWLYFNARGSNRVAGYIPSMKPEPYVRSTSVLDVEMMANGICVLIDVLADDKGAETSSGRSLEAVMAEGARLSSDIRILRVRTIHETLESALADSTLSMSDGVIAIPRLLMSHVYKIKHVKSMELELAADGSLVTSDGVVMAVLHPHSDLCGSCTAGDIIEIRFTCSSDMMSYNVVELLPRPDKTKANAMKAITAITTSAYEDTERQKIVVNSAESYCFAIRQVIYKFASKCVTATRPAILDVGSGRGQSIDCITRNGFRRVVFVDKDATACKMLAKKLRLDTIHTNIDSARIGIGSVINGKRSYAIVAMDLQTLLADEKIRHYIVRGCACMVGSMSVNYVYHEVQQLNDSGIAVIGCCYTYDSADDDGYIVNQPGVSMRLDRSRRVATVEWSSKPYEEPALMFRDVRGGLAAMYATDLVECSNSEVAVFIKSLALIYTSSLLNRLRKVCE